VSYFNYIFIFTILTVDILSCFHVEESDWVIALESPGEMLRPIHRDPGLLRLEGSLDIRVLKAPLGDSNLQWRFRPST
jgi:hypothetical protein